MNEPPPNPAPPQRTQLLLSQLPNLESVAGASAVGAAMSLMYTGIALVLCFASVKNRLGSPLGRPAPPVDKVFGVFNALGSILFSNASAVLTIDASDTGGRGRDNGRERGQPSQAQACLL